MQSASEVQRGLLIQLNEYVSKGLLDETSKNRPKGEGRPELPGVLGMQAGKRDLFPG